MPVTRIIPLFILLLFSLFSGCRTAAPEEEAFRQARTAILENRASSLLISGDRILGWNKGRGLTPLLDLYDQYEDRFEGCIVVDKVIGRAAAFIAVRGGASRVYGKIMSEPARVLLIRHGIQVQWDLLVPNILDRSRRDICPLEKSVIGIENPVQAMPAIRRCVAEQLRLEAEKH